MVLVNNVYIIERGIDPRSMAKPKRGVTYTRYSACGEWVKATSNGDGTEVVIEKGRYKHVPHESFKRGDRVLMKWKGNSARSRYPAIVCDSDRDNDMVCVKWEGSKYRHVPSQWMFASKVVNKLTI